MAEPRCQASFPPLVDLGDGHSVACFRVTKLNELGEFSYGTDLATELIKESFAKQRAHVGSS
jgi:hypothetical protein